MLRNLTSFFLLLLLVSGSIVTTGSVSAQDSQDPMKMRLEYKQKFESARESGNSGERISAGENFAAIERVMVDTIKEHFADDKQLLKNAQFSLMEVLIFLGKEYENQKKYAQAAAIFEELGPVVKAFDDPQFSSIDWNQRAAFAKQMSSLNAEQQSQIERATQLLIRAQEHVANQQLDEARELATEALDISKSVWGRRNGLNATFITTLATVRFRQGEVKQAERMLRRSVTMTENISGKNSASYASVMENMGGILAAQNEHKEAAEYLQQAFDIRRNIFGDDHPKTRNTAALLGQVQQQIQSNERASRSNTDSESPSLSTRMSRQKSNVNSRIQNCNQTSTRSNRNSYGGRCPN